MASPIGSRSVDKPLTSRSSRSIAPEKVVAVLGQRIQQCSQVVDQLLDDLVLSANAFENDDVFENSDYWTLALQDLNQRRGERVHVFRFRPWITGFSPPSSRSRSRAGAVRSTGIWEPTGSIFVDPGLSASSRKRSPVRLR